MAVRFSALRAGRALPPQKDHLLLIPVRGWLNLRAIVLLERLAEFKNLIGNQIRDLPACNIVPQPSMLRRETRHDFFLQCASRCCHILAPNDGVCIARSSVTGLGNYTINSQVCGINVIFQKKSLIYF
jgi:hypothetical protein